MQNIEIKAHYPDLEKGRKIAKQAGAKPAGKLHQIDTYFVVARGRLKLREINGCEAELICYDRPDQAGPKTSAYQICPVTDSEKLKLTLKSALGIWQVVEKHRELFLYDEVRIHLDDVAGLGHFLEFEGVLSETSDPDEMRQKVEMLMTRFQIKPEDLVEISYSDLMPKIAAAGASHFPKCVAP